MVHIIFRNFSVHSINNTFPKQSLTDPIVLHKYLISSIKVQDFRYKTLEPLRSQNPFQVIFNPVKSINTGTYYRTIHPQNIALSRQDVFITYMDKLIEHNENLDTPGYLSSHLESLKEKHEYFEVPDLETKILRHNNPHYWLQQDIKQFKQFHYRFFQNVILNEDTVPQIKVFSHFLLRFIRFNYQLIWEQQDQNAYFNFPQVLTETELLPFIIRDTNKHIYYSDPTSFNITQFELIKFETIFNIEHSETSNNRPYTTPNLISEPLLDKYSPHILQHDTGQNILHNNQDDNTKFFQNPKTSQFNNVPDPSETATIQNVSEISEETTNNPQSFTITDDSNIVLIPVHNITQTLVNDQTPNDTIHNTNQDNTSTLSTSNTLTTQELQPQQNYTTKL